MQHLYHTYIRTLCLAGIAGLLLVVPAAFAQNILFQQNFTGPGPYTSGTPNSTQFDAIYVQNGAILRLNSGQGYVEFERTGSAGSGSGRIVRSTNLSPVPTTMYYQVRMSVPLDTSLTSTVATFNVGQNLSSTDNSIPNDQNIFAKFSVNFLGNNRFSFRRTGTNAVNSGTYSGSVLITWVMNNESTPLPYLTPLGTKDILNPKSFDLWINNDRFLRNYARISGSEVALSDFSFRFQAGAGIIRLSDFLIRDVSGILPVDLISFRAQPTGNQVELAWETAWERNSKEFIVQRSTDLKEFDDIGRIAAAGEAQSRNQYTFIDNSPQPGANYYRLRQVDNDGTYEYSKVVDAIVRPGVPMVLVSPNPATSQVIRLRTYGTDVSSLRLTNLLGQEISFRAHNPGGDVVELLPQQPLPMGLYLLSLEQNGHRQHTKVLVR
ncbi:T9SS type A sorting domain-containing protein [Telluribacter humicola]|uniref:T9SS type A sorting domain-containing protein n=1 Tax=Telluribacter humicola TaxID=1720261 RepID=UPI001A961E65|nr:T9SS type A sorting domain-containing protein [Telluribacter humicola]